MNVFEFSPEQLLESNFTAKFFYHYMKVKIRPITCNSEVSQFIAYLKLQILVAAIQDFPLI